MQLSDINKIRFEFRGQYSNLYKAFATIYTMSGPDGVIFYIGCTVKPIEERMQEHIKEARERGDHALTPKIKMIRAIGYKITIKALDIIWITGTSSYSAAKRAKNIESRWIAKYLNDGYVLTNFQYKMKENKLLKFKEDYKLWASKQKDQTA